MASLSDIRAKYPEYGYLSDAELAGAMHKKFYADMPREEFDKRVGLPAQEQPREKRAANPLAEPGAAERVLRYTPIGSWLDEIGAAGDAAIHWATGGRTGAPYEEARAAREEAQRRSDEQNQTRNTAEGVVGAIATAPMLPAMALFRGTTLLPQAANMALTGLGYGGFYGLGEGSGGERASNAATGGAIAAAINAATPPIARGLGNAANTLANWARPLPQGVERFSKDAISRVARAAGDDDLLTAYSRQARELGPEGMIADMGPNLRGQASAIATQPGAGQRQIVQALEGRQQGATGRIAADVDANLGPARNLVQLEDNVVGQARLQAAPHYEQFYQTQIPMTPELNAIVPRLDASGVMRQAQRLAQIEGRHRPGAQITGREWDLMKRAADDLARAAGPGTNEQRLFQGLSRDLRNAVDNALSPGQPDASPWAIARGIAGDGMQFREGLEEGARAFSRGVHPDQMAADLAQMPHVQRAGYNEGARGQIRDIMGNAATAQGEQGATKARQALGSEYARRKIALVAGQPGAPTTQGPYGSPLSGQAAADRLTRRLDAETTFANTRNQVYQGSQTASRNAAQKEFPNAANTSAASEVGKKSLSGIALEGTYRLGNLLLGGALNERRALVATDAARMLMAQGVDRATIVRGLRQYIRDQGVNTAAARNVERFINQLMAGTRQQFINSMMSDPPMVATEEASLPGGN